jgi:hypothetical protein
MSNIDKKTIAELFDQLITTSLHCWFAQEQVMTETDTTKIAEAAKRAQEANARRNLLIRAIDERLGETTISQLRKTYSND